MSHKRMAQLRELYGFDFPDDLFEFWEWYNGLNDEHREAFSGDLGIGLVGPFSVLAGEFDDVQLRYPAVLHWRFRMDPAEFFSVFCGDCDGLHWGYWFDDPGKAQPAVARYYSNDAFELTACGSDLFAAVSDWLQLCLEDVAEDLEDDPNDEDFRERLAALESLEGVLPSRQAKEARQYTYWTDEGMGIVIGDENDALSKQFVEEKNRWTMGERRFDELARIYDGLDRPTLANVMRVHGAHSCLPSVNILQFRRGDYHSFEEALANPDQVIRIEIGERKIKELPDLSQLIHLEELSFWGNEISDLPASLAGCKNLRSVNLHRNQLKQLPRVLFELPQLETVTLSNNRISELPEDLSRLTGLKNLHLHGNNFSESEIDRIKNALHETKVS